MADQERIDALVIGAGPAGLMAAQVLAEAGRRVVIAEAKPSPARKLLMAGKSGLNLTKDEPLAKFLSHFDETADHLTKCVEKFDNAAVVKWAESIGQTLFTGSTGRVFPTAMKASPLLRAWLARLDDAGVQLHRNWRWAGWENTSLRFETPDGTRHLMPNVTVLALGGASWPRLGSDAAWVPWVRDKGVEVSDFAPSNAALRVDWSPHMAKHFGAPIKAVALKAGSATSRGEVILSASGIEGGGIYPLSKPLREGAPLLIDLMPDLSEVEITQRLGRPRGKASMSNHLRKTLGLTPAKIAMLNEFARPLPPVQEMAAELKALSIPHQGLRPISEAISSAGGITAGSLTDGLMLRAVPGVFAAGEMLDWDAPTGGYLISGCLATGRAAGLAAAAYAGES